MCRGISTFFRMYNGGKSGGFFQLCRVLIKCLIQIGDSCPICPIVVYEEIAGAVSGRWFFLLCPCYSISYGSFGGCKFMVWGTAEAMTIVYWAELPIEPLCSIFSCSS